MTSVAIQFDRPVGLHRDIAEIEFVTALLQTSKTFLRKSVSAKDVVIYLRSRHGIVVTEETVRKLLVTDLAGATCETVEHNCIDPCQLLAILLIPQFLVECAGEVSKEEEMTGIVKEFDKELKCLRFGDNVETLRKLMADAGEINVSESLLQDMIALWKECGGDIGKVLVSDLEAFQPTLDQLSLSGGEHLKSVETSEQSPVSTKNDKVFSLVTTAAFMDFTADTYRRPLFHALLVGCGVATYFAYVLNIEYEWLNCNAEKTVCEVGKGLVAWLTLFMQLVVLGLPFVVLGSLGNSTTTNTAFYAIRSLISIGSICLFTIYPFFVSMDTRFFYTDGNKGFESFESYCSAFDDDGVSLEDCLDTCNGDPSLCPLQYDAKVDVYGASYWLSIGLGCTLIAIIVGDLVLFVSRKAGFRPVCQPLSTQHESVACKAANHQMSRILQNAFCLQKGQEDRIGDDVTRRLLKRMSPNSSILDRFHMLPESTETVGGVFWTWKKISDGSLFSQEGLWISGRILACNFAQIIVVGMVIFFTMFWMNQKGDLLYTKSEAEINEYVASIKLDLQENPAYQTQAFVEDLTQFATCIQTTLQIDFDEIWADWREEWWSIGSRLVQTLDEAFDFEGVEVILIERNDLDGCLAATENIDAIFQYLLHTEISLHHVTDELKDLTTALDISHREFNAGSWIALLAGCMVSLSTAMVLIPAYASSVLKFRSGYTPSLSDREFLRCRFAPDVVTTLIGSAFWGTFFTSVAAMVLAAAVAAFFTTIGPALIGAVVGFLVVLVIRIVVLLTLRGRFFAAFYRTKPAAANVMMVVLEVWNIGLTVGFVLARVVKLLAICIFFIARIDTPVLAPGVGRIGPIELDGSSLAFKKELLAHESHRHVLIERFGLMCINKLHLKAFASRAGSAWRLLFVLSMMPWLRRYRVANSTLEDADQTVMNDLEAEEKSENAPLDEQSKTKMLKQIKRLRERNKFLEQKIVSVLKESTSAQEYEF